MQITQLNLFPIKSTQAYSVEQAFVQQHGLNFDRELMLTEPDGSFISARKDAALYQLSAFPIAGGVAICHANGEKRVVTYAEFGKQQPSEVWGNQFPSWVASAETNAWLSRFIGREIQLRWLGEKSARVHASQPDTIISFADSYPLLLVSEQSLNQVQQWSPVPVKMAQFRANIVIDGLHAFEEEQWQRIKLGEVYFRVTQACTRCILITRDPQTLALEPQAEPFRSLKKHHTNEKGKPIFGIHLIPENEGVIRVTDRVEIIDFQANNR